MLIPTGKHKGEDIMIVPTEYLEWALENFERETTDQKALLEAIRAELTGRARYHARKVIT